MSFREELSLEMRYTCCVLGLQDDPEVTETEDDEIT